MKITNLKKIPRSLDALFCLGPEKRIKDIYSMAHSCFLISCNMLRNGKNRVQDDISVTKYPPLLSAQPITSHLFLNTCVAQIRFSSKDKKL